MLVRSGGGKLAPDIAAAAQVTEDQQRAFDGATAVVSAIQGGPEVIVDRQLDMLRAARAAGVRRFFPSDYSLNFFGLAEGENINSDWRREFARRADQERGPVEVIHVLQGCFLDEGVLLGFLKVIDLETRTAHFWGDGNEKMQLTTYADTAAYVAEAALTGDGLPERLFVAGDMVSFHELVADVAASLDQTITAISKGSLADLDAEIATRMADRPADIPHWLPLMYWRAMLNGKGKPGPLANDRFASIEPMTARQYFAELASRGTRGLPPTPLR